MMDALKITLLRVLFVAGLAIIIPGVGSAQETSEAEVEENGFLVLAGIEDGPARVFVDGTERASLRSDELTLELVPGVHIVEVLAQGRMRFERSVAVLSGDVVYLQVILAASAQLRVVHLEPARVDVRVQGQVVALTPATVTIPAGETTIGVGEWTFCFDLAENADAYVRVRNGRVDEVRGGEDCTGARAGESFEAPHLLLSEGDFTRRSLWNRQRSGGRVEEMWPLLSAAFSHDGSLVLATLRGGQVVVWDNQTGQEVRRFQTLDDVWSSALSPNGDQVLARLYLSSDEPMLLDSHTGALDRRFRAPDQVGTVAMSFDGSVLVLGSPYGYVALIDADSGDEITRFATHGEENEAEVQLFRQKSVGLSPDGTRVFAVIPATSEVVVWDVQTGVETLRFPTSTDIEDAAFSPDGQFLLTATAARRRSGLPGEVVVWDAETGAEIQHFPTATEATMVSFSPDGRFLLASSFDELVVWTLFSGA